MCKFWTVNADSFSDSYFLSICNQGIACYGMCDALFY